MEFKMHNLKEIKRLSFNFIYSIISNVAPYALAIVVMMYAARAISVNELNDYQVAYNFVLMMMLFTDMGISSIFIRLIKGDRNVLQQKYGSFFIIRLAIVTLLTVASLVVGVILYGWGLFLLLLLACIGQIFFNIGLLLMSCFQSLEHFKYLGIGAIIRGVLYTVTAIPLVYLFGAYGIAYSLILTNAISLIYYYYYFKQEVLKENKFSLNYDSVFSKTLVKQSIPVMSMSLVNTISMTVDDVILSVVKYSDAIYYSLPSMIALSFGFLAASYANMMYPYLCKDGVKNRKMVAQTYIAVNIVIVILCIILIVFAGDIVHILYGWNYDRCIPILQVLAATLFFYSQAIILYNFAVALHMEKKLFNIQVVLVISNTALNLILCPMYGSLGAAIACFFTIGVINCFMTAYLFKDNVLGILKCYNKVGY